MLYFQECFQKALKEGFEGFNLETGQPVSKDELKEHYKWIINAGWRTEENKICFSSSSNQFGEIFAEAENALEYLQPSEKYRGYVLAKAYDIYSNELPNSLALHKIK